MELKAIRQKKGETSLLESCVLGATQNQSEILNALVWAGCPKRKHRGHKAVSCAVASAVCLIHKGSESRFGAKKRFSIPSVINTKRAVNIRRVVTDSSVASSTI